MTIQTLLNKVNEEKPNSFGTERLISFINEIEVEVAEQLAYDENEIPVYTNTAEDMNKMLIAPAPYDRLYVSYVKSMVDYANEEYGSYQNNAAQHTQDFRDFVDWVVREGKAYESVTPTRLRNIF